MEQELLRKEEEFHKLNAELEMKTNELMKEVECVMKIQDQLSKKSPFSGSGLQKCSQSPSFDDDVNANCNEYLYKEAKKRSGAPRLRTGFPLTLQQQQQQPFAKNRGISAGNLRSKDVAARPIGLPNKLGLDQGERTQVPEAAPELGDDFLPEAGKGMGAEALVRYFRAKAKLLQEECESLQKELKKLVEECRHTQANLQQLEEERNRWQQQAGTNKEKLNKQEQVLAAINKKLGEKETENTALRKEVESLKKEMKQTTQSYGNNEIRLNRSLEEIEKLKSALKHAKLEEKELCEGNRKKMDEIVLTTKRLEKQKMELVTAFKKQLQLVDNLKKQKAHLEASRVVQFTEEEFLKLLEWNPDT